MSNVTSYMVVSDYGEECEKVINKLKEIFRVTNPEYKEDIQEPDLNEYGNKYCQFMNPLFFAFNYFNDDEFETWYIKQGFKSVQVFRMKEHDEQISELQR